MNNNSIVNFLSILVILFSMRGFSDVRYVSKTGKSEFPYTSWETAADSIPKCIRACSNGDTIYFANGIYKDSLYIDKEISLIGSSMDSTVIDGTGLAEYTIESMNALNFQNFTVYGKAWGIGVVILANATLNMNSCRVCNGAGGVYATDGKINNVIIQHCKYGYGSICISDSCHFYISNCIILPDTWNSEAINTGLGTEFFINNNIIVYAYKGSPNANYGIIMSWPKRVYVYNNLISGFGWNIYIDMLDDTAFIKNNIISNCPHWGDDLSFGSFESQNRNVVIRNNIFENNGNSAVSANAPYASINYNLFWNNGNDIYGSPYGNGDIVADPMFIKDSLPSELFNYDFHLQAFSPGINRGDPSILNKNGSRSDIGMYGGPYGEVYKYDDLAPKPPKNLTASVDSARITLHWKNNTEADIAYYNLYRDTLPDFTITPVKLVSRQKDTIFAQSFPVNTKYLYYKVTAEDKAGHVSAPSSEITVSITSIDNIYLIVNDYKLFQNYPNPFNPVTTISYNIKEKGYVKLMVYDITGRLIKVLANEIREKGYYETEFNSKGLASGIYLYRIEVISKSNIPVYSEMKKMILLK